MNPAKNSRAIFKKFAGLVEKIPFQHLGDFPTPIQKLNNLGKELGLSELWVKRDDLSHQVYGGNKIRKLEFLLGDVLKRKRTSVLTIGAAGSNHILATTYFSSQLGIKSLAVMVPQPVQEYARVNLLANFALGCELNYAQSQLLLPALIAKVYFKHLNPSRNERPYFIWAGGSTPLGTLGYVNAGLEISEQIREEGIKEPDFIFCAVGSCGTFAGLWLGCKLAGLKTKVIGVRVYDKIGANRYVAFYLAKRALSLMRRFDSTVAELNLRAKDFIILDNYFGKGYAYFTKSGLEAVRLAKETEGLKLEGTYTGKALAGLIDFSRKQPVKDKVILFLDSYNSRDISKIAEKAGDYRHLPCAFHRYFEEDIEKPTEE